MQLTLDEMVTATPAVAHWHHVGIRHHHGLLVPLFALHSQERGIGTYTDLITLAPWCQQIGFDVIQLLPLNDIGCDTSPYSSLSAFALNPIHLNLKALPYITDDVELQTLLQQEPRRANEQLRIDYQVIRTFQEKFLRAYVERQGLQIREEPAFTAFLQTPWLKNYALYKALKQSQGWKSWEEWPEEMRSPTAEQKEALCQIWEKDVFFHSVVQYLCWQQWSLVRQATQACGVLLKGDLPILINRDSADVWGHRKLFNLDLCAGAPPDMYSDEGQNWGIPLYRWDEQHEALYTWWQQRLSSASELYDLYRIDHVVGFFRIWAVLASMSARTGSYIPPEPNLWIPQGEERMRHLLASAPLLPIAEDLGVVPDEVRACLSRLGICGTKVLRWQRDWEGDGHYYRPQDYSPLSLTTVSTHDTSLLRQWWQEMPEEASSFAKLFDWSYTPELSLDQQKAILHLSHHSGSLWHINLLSEYLDLFPDLRWNTLQDARVNVPGTVADSNWSGLLRPSVEQLIEHHALADTLRSMRQ